MSSAVYNMVMLNNRQIRELRLALGLKAPEFAEIMGVTEDTIWRWERGDRHPTFKKLEKLGDMWTDATEKGLFKAVPA